MLTYLFSSLLAAIAQTQLSYALANPGMVHPETPHSGPNVTVEHLFYHDIPTGVAVSRTGRKFIAFNRPSTFTVGEIFNSTYEVAFPNLQMNTPPSLVSSTDPAYASNYKDYFINAQNVVSK
jgi:hypothetical protein